MAGGAPADPGASCTGTTCLLRDRVFRVKSWYRLDGGSTSRAAAVSVDLGGSAGLYAFESGNPELLVRIADTCSTTGYWTVYAGAASDAVFSVAIRDTGTNELKWFRSSGGRAYCRHRGFRLPLSVATFDTLAAVRNLEKAGMGTSQAEAVTETIRIAVFQGVATKDATLPGGSVLQRRRPTAAAR